MGKNFVMGYHQIQIKDIKNGWICNMCHSHSYAAIVLEKTNYFFHCQLNIVKDQQVLFRGIVLEDTKNYKYSILFVVSLSYLFDIPEEKKFHFYQSYSLQEVIENIVMEYKQESELLDIPEETIELIQNNETDWEFITRILSIHSLVPEIIHSKIVAADYKADLKFKFLVHKRQEGNMRRLFYIRDASVREALSGVEIKEHMEVQSSGRKKKNAPILFQADEKIYFQSIMYHYSNWETDTEADIKHEFKSFEVLRVLGLLKDEEKHVGSEKYRGIIIEKKEQQELYRVCFPVLERNKYPIYPQPQKKRRDKMIWIRAEQFSADSRETDYNKWDIVEVILRSDAIHSAYICGLIERQAEDIPVLYSMFTSKEEWKKMDLSEKEALIKGVYDYTQDPALPNLRLEFKKVHGYDREMGGYCKVQTDKNGNYVYNDESHIAYNSKSNQVDIYDNDCPGAYELIYHERGHLKQYTDAKTKAEFEKKYGPPKGNYQDYLNSLEEKEANNAGAEGVKQMRIKKDERLEIFQFTKDKKELRSMPGEGEFN